MSVVKTTFFFITLLFFASFAHAAKLEHPPERALWEFDKNNDEKFVKAKNAISNGGRSCPESWAEYCEREITRESCKGYFYSIRDQVIRENSGLKKCLPLDFAGMKTVYYSWLVRNREKYKSMNADQLKIALKQSNITTYNFMFEEITDEKNKQNNEYMHNRAAYDLSEVTFHDSVYKALKEAANCKINQ
jgi:hypothetical protein